MPITPSKGSLFHAETHWAQHPAFLQNRLLQSAANAAIFKAFAILHGRLIYITSHKNISYFTIYYFYNIIISISKMYIIYLYPLNYYARSVISIKIKYIYVTP